MESKERTLHIIVEGRFSKNGNFLGIDSIGLDIHIYKKQMELLNLKYFSDITFPLFAIGKVKTFNKLTGEPGDEGRLPIVYRDGTKVKFSRLTSMAVFTSYDKLKDALYSGITLSEESDKMLRSERESMRKELEDKIESFGLKEYDHTSLFKHLGETEFEKETRKDRIEIDNEIEKFHQHYFEYKNSRNKFNNKS